MWREFYLISWGVIIVNGVVGSFLELGLKVVYPPVVEWVVMFVPLCFFGYIVGFWTFGKVRERRGRREARERWERSRDEVLTQRGQM
jgi:hypothetical protein